MADSNETQELLASLKEIHDNLNGIGESNCSDKVKLGKEIGKGSFATVYEGEYEGRVVAVKVTNTQKDLKDIKKTIEREAFISKLLTLRDKNCPIIPIEQVYMCEDKIYLIMQLSKGYDLRQLIRQRNRDMWYYKPYTEMSQKFIINLEITILLLKGLKCLHDNNVYHLDIKLDNILLDLADPTNVVKYIDFGFGCVKTDDLGIPEEYNKLDCASSRGMRGTATFLHPYSWHLPGRIKIGKVTPSHIYSVSQIKDIYALGVTLYMLWEGVELFVNAKSMSKVREFARVWAKEYSKYKDDIDKRMLSLGWRPDLYEYVEDNIPEYRKVMKWIDYMTSFKVKTPVLDYAIEDLEKVLESVKK